MKTNVTVKKLETLLLENGFTKNSAIKTIGGWGGNIDVFLINFYKGHENVFITVNKPQKGAVPWTYEDYLNNKGISHNER